MLFSANTSSGIRSDLSHWAPVAGNRPHLTGRLLKRLKHLLFDFSLGFYIRAFRVSLCPRT